MQTNWSQNKSNIVINQVLKKFLITVKFWYTGDGYTNNEYIEKSEKNAHTQL